MRSMRPLPIAGILALSAILCAEDKARLSLKTGLWEITSTVATNEELPVPAAILEKLTPERRARLEQRMKADGTTTRVREQCVISSNSTPGSPYVSWK